MSGSAVEALNANGVFNLEPPSAPGARPIISAQRAGELALASVRTWERSLRHAWERESGRSIDPSTLEVGPRIFFARTPYAEFPEGYHPAFPRMFGPYYVVPLYSGGEAVLLVSVAAYNSEVVIDARGLVRRPVDHGMEFLSMALPADTSLFRLISPEEAVAHVGRSTGARVTVTPELVRPGLPHAPAAAVWRLTLDRSVAVKARGRGTVHRVRTLYVGPERDRRLLAAIPAPGQQRVKALTTGASEQLQHVDLPIRAGEAVTFDPVDLAEGVNR